MSAESREYNRRVKSVEREGRRAKEELEFNWGIFGGPDGTEVTLNGIKKNLQLQLALSDSNTQLLSLSTGRSFPRKNILLKKAQDLSTQAGVDAAVLCFLTASDLFFHEYKTFLFANPDQETEESGRRIKAIDAAVQLICPDDPALRYDNLIIP